jgi:hypothetical protein
LVPDLYAVDYLGQGTHRRQQALVDRLLNTRKQYLHVESYLSSMHRAKKRTSQHKKRKSSQP